jgi:hypothetical protein
LTHAAPKLKRPLILEEILESVGSTLDARRMTAIKKDVVLF